MKAIINAFTKLYNEHFSILILCILALILSIFVIVFFGFKFSKKKKQKMHEENVKKAVSSLTPEEIDNISNNASDPDAVKQILVPKVEQPTKKTKQTKKQSATKPVETDTPAVEEQTNPKDTKKTSKKAKGTNEQTPAKQDNPPAPQQAFTPAKRTYVGKWKINEENGKFYAELYASNGGMLLRTKVYSSITGVKNGIETIKKNIDSGNIAIGIDKHNHYHFKLFSSTNMLICVSEDYSSKAKCESGIESVKRFAKTATIIKQESKTEKE